MIMYGPDIHDGKYNGKLSDYHSHFKLEPCLDKRYLLAVDPLTLFGIHTIDNSILDSYLNNNLVDTYKYFSDKFGRSLNSNERIALGAKFVKQHLIIIDRAIVELNLYYDVNDFPLPTNGKNSISSHDRGFNLQKLYNANDNYPISVELPKYSIDQPVSTTSKQVKREIPAKLVKELFDQGKVKTFRELLSSRISADERDVMRSFKFEDVYSGEDCLSLNKWSNMECIFHSFFTSCHSAQLCVIDFLIRSTIGLDVLSSIEFDHPVTTISIDILNYLHTIETDESVLKQVAKPFQAQPQNGDDDEIRTLLDNKWSKTGSSATLNPNEHFYERSDKTCTSYSSLCRSPYQLNWHSPINFVSGIGRITASLIYQGNKICTTLSNPVYRFDEQHDGSELDSDSDNDIQPGSEMNNDVYVKNRSERRLRTNETHETIGLDKGCKVKCYFDYNAGKFRAKESGRYVQNAGIEIIISNHSDNGIHPNELSLELNAEAETSIIEEEYYSPKNEVVAESETFIGTPAQDGQQVETASEKHTRVKTKLRKYLPSNMIADFVFHKLMVPYISEILYDYDEERGVYELNRRRQPLPELSEDNKFIVRYSKNNETIDSTEVEPVNKLYTQNHHYQENCPRWING